MKFLSFLTVLLLSMIGFGTVVFGANFDLLTVKTQYSEELWIKLSGEIELYDAPKFKKLLNENPSVKTIWLESHGGLIGPSIDIGITVNDSKLNTYVDTQCLSGCGLIFLAGETRYISAAGTIGIHNAYNITTKENSFVSTAYEAWFLGYIKMPAELVAVMAANTSHDKLLFLDTKKGRNDFQLQIPPDIISVKKWGD